MCARQRVGKTAGRLGGKGRGHHPYPLTRHRPVGRTPQGGKPPAATAVSYNLPANQPTLCPTASGPDQVLMSVMVPKATVHCAFWGRTHRALCTRCAKSRLFSTTSSHGSQGREFCTLQPLLVHQGFFVSV